MLQATKFLLAIHSVTKSQSTLIVNQEEPRGSTRFPNIWQYSSLPWVHFKVLRIPHTLNNHLTLTRHCTPSISFLISEIHMEITENRQHPPGGHVVWPSHSATEQARLLSVILLPPAWLLLVMMLPFKFYLQFSSEFHSLFHKSRNLLWLE